MNAKQHERMLCIFHLLSHEMQAGGLRDGATSYELARYLNCTPQTVLNNLKKYGERFAIKYDQFVHRLDENGDIQATKFVWYLDENSPLYRFWRNHAKRAYKMQLEGQSHYKVLKVNEGKNER